MPNNLGLIHQFVSAKADGVDATLVRASNWNAAHGLAGTAANDGMKLVANSLNSPQNAELLLPDVTQLVNKTGLAHAVGDVVAVGTAAIDKSVQLDDTQGSFRTFVVALQANADAVAGIYARAGVITGVLAQGVIARWQYVRKSATTKAIEDAGVAYSTTALPPAGALGVALTAAAAGTVTVLWFGTTFNQPTIAAKGDILSGSGANTLVKTAVSATDGSFLRADSTAAGGISYATKFTSTDQAITINSTLNVAHGLGAKPSLVQVTLKCATAEGGYSVGDEIPIALGQTNSAAFGGHSSFDTTNVSVILPNSITIVNKSTQANFSITTANWKLVVRAWL